MGWTQGRNLEIEYRWAEGRAEHYAELAAELVRLKADVIVTDSTPSALAIKRVTSAIPIIIAAAGGRASGGLGGLQNCSRAR